MTPRSLLLSMALLLALPGALLLPAPAAAQEEVCSSMSTSELTQAMDGVDRAFSDFLLDDARYMLREARKRIRCLDTLVRPADFARFARQQALMAFFDQDELGSTRWAHAAVFAAPDLPWPAHLPDDHPLRNMLAFADEPEWSTLDGMVIVPPKGGAVFVAGRFAREPKVYSDVPVLVQALDKKGRVAEAWWQDGASFPAAVVATAGGKNAPPSPPKWYTPDGTSDDAVADAQESKKAAEPKEAEPKKAAEPKAEADGKAEAKADGKAEAKADGKAEAKAEAKKAAEPKDEPKSEAKKAAEPKDEPKKAAEPVAGADAARDRKVKESLDTPPRTPKASAGPSVGLLGAGAGLGALAIGMYLGATQQQNGLTTAGTAEQLSRARSRTNLLAVGSTVTGAAALGSGVTAFVSADGAGLGWSLRW